MKNNKKMDEMEMDISFKALRISWDFGIAFVLIWLLVDWVHSKSYNNIASILLFCELVIYWTVQIYLKWKLGRDEE